MKINNIEFKAYKKSKRVGRGTSGKGGKTGGRGTKGQRARAGFNVPIGFEGGQTKLFRKLPKAGGFKSRKPRNYIIQSSKINDNFKDGENVSIKTLSDKKMLSDRTSAQKVKILFDKPLKVKVILASNILASKKIKKAGK